MLKQTAAIKFIKILPCAGLFPTSALWHDYKILEVSTHLGPPNDAVGGGLYILPVSGSPILAPFGETTNRLSCQRGDLC